MERVDIERSKLTLDDLARVEEEGGVEPWHAHDIMEFPGYAPSRNFEAAAKKAMVSVEGSKPAGEHHCADVGKMIELGSGPKREAKDCKLARYGCRVIAERRPAQGGNYERRVMGESCRIGQKDAGISCVGGLGRPGWRAGVRYT